MCLLLPPPFASHHIHMPVPLLSDIVRLYAKSDLSARPVGTNARPKDQRHPSEKKVLPGEASPAYNLLVWRRSCLHTIIVGWLCLLVTGQMKIMNSNARDQHEGNSGTFPVNVSSLIQGFHDDCVRICESALSRTSALADGEISSCASVAAATRDAAPQGLDSSTVAAFEAAALAACRQSAARVMDAARVDCLDNCLDSSYDPATHSHFPASCTGTPNSSDTPATFWAANAQSCTAAARRPRPGQATWQQFVHVEGHVTTGARALSLVFAVGGALTWTDMVRSRRLALTSYAAYTFFASAEILLVPWYSVMGFDEAIDSASMGDSSDVKHKALIEALKLEYRTKVATSIHAKSTALLTALPGALCKATLTLKTLFPQSSLWSIGMIAFPMLKLLMAVPSLGLYNQLFSSWFFLFFAFFASTSFWYYMLAAPIFQRHRDDDPTQALATFKKWKTRVHYPWLLLELGFLVAFLWPLLTMLWQVIESGQVRVTAGEEEYATRYLAHHWGMLIWDAIEIILLYLASTFLTTLVLVDGLTHVTLLRTADGQYTDRPYAGLELLAAVVAGTWTSPRVEVAVMVAGEMAAGATVGEGTVAAKEVAMAAVGMVEEMAVEAPALPTAEPSTATKAVAPTA